MNSKSIASIIILVIGIINWVLTALGISPLEVSGETINTGVTLVVTVAGAIGAAWYNLSLTEPAQLAQTLLQNIKNGNVDFNKAYQMVMELVGEVKKTA